MKRLSLAMVTLLACAGAQAASEKVEMMMRRAINAAHPRDK